MTTGLQYAGQNIDRGQNLERPIDCRPAKSRIAGAEIGDELFGREWTISGQNRLGDGSARQRQAVAMLAQDIGHLGDRR